MAKDKISRPYDGEKIKITKGEYGEIEKLFNEINRKVDLDNFTYSIDPITKHLSIWMHYWEGITFESPQIPSILGFKCIRDGTGYHIGYINLDYKKLLVNNIQSIAVNLRTETGTICTICGRRRKSCFDLKISKIF